MKVGIYREADIRKAYEAGRKAGVRLSIESVLSVVTLKLQDRHGMGTEELRQLSHEVNEDFQQVLDGCVALADIIGTKHEEIDAGKDSGPMVHSEREGEHR